MLHKFFIYIKLKIKAYWQTFQFYKPTYSSMWWLITNMHYVMVGNLLQVPYVDTDHRPYITILMFLILMFLIYTFSLGITGWKHFTCLKLWKCSQISHTSPRLESIPNRTKTNHHWLNDLQPTHTTLNYATPLPVGLRRSSQTPGVIQGNCSSFPWLTPEIKV